MLVPLPPSPPSHSISAPTPYGLGGAYLDMTLADWRAGTYGDQPNQACAPPSNDIVVCHAKSFNLGGDFLARDPSLTFATGKLVRISFKTSINGFNFATAALKRRFGDPESITRDSATLADGMVFPHVLLTWSNGRSTIKLNDPEPDMSVSVTIQSNLYRETQIPSKSTG